MDPNLKQEIIQKIEVFFVMNATRVLAVAISDSKEYHKQMKDYHPDGLIPFGGYVYNHHSETLKLNCLEYHDLGYVPFGAILSIDGMKIRIPIPSEILEKQLTTQQKQTLDSFRSHYPVDKVKFKLLQFVADHDNL